MARSHDQALALTVEAELARFHHARRRGLTVEAWDDGRCRIACATGMRITRCTELLELLRGIPADASWRTIWSELFDVP